MERVQCVFQVAQLCILLQQIAQRLKGEKEHMYKGQQSMSTKLRSFDTSRVVVCLVKVRKKKKKPTLTVPYWSQGSLYLICVFRHRSQTGHIGRWLQHKYWKCPNNADKNKGTYNITVEFWNLYFKSIMVRFSLTHYFVWQQVTDP